MFRLPSLSFIPLLFLAIFLFLSLSSPLSFPLSLTSLSSSLSLSPSFHSFSSSSLFVSAKLRTLSEADMRKLEAEWMEDEEEGPDDIPFKWKKNAKGELTPPAPSPGQKTEMAFVTLKKKDKSNTDKMSGRWSDQLTTGGVQNKAYPIEDDKVLFTSEGTGEMRKIQNFLLKQKSEVKEFEWNSQKLTPKEGEETEEELEQEDKMADIMAQIKSGKFKLPTQ